MAVAIARTDLSEHEFRVAGATAKDAKASRRMPAIALVLEGVDRETAAESCGMARRTLGGGEEDRETVRWRVRWRVFPTNGHRCNADGLEGLSDRRSAGPAPRLSAEQTAELARMVREGPDPALDVGGALAARRPSAQDRGAPLASPRPSAG